MTVSTPESHATTWWRSESGWRPLLPFSVGLLLGGLLDIAVYAVPRALGYDEISWTYLSTGVISIVIAGLLVRRSGLKWLGNGVVVGSLVALVCVFTGLLALGSAIGG